jgi:hypothetical protein
MDPTATPLLTTVRDEMIAYLHHLAARVERAVRAVPAEKLWVKPFPFGNSLGTLVLHLTGNLNHYVGAKIADTGYVRDRPREFADPGGYPADVILHHFHAAVGMVAATIAALDEPALCQPMTDEPPVRTTFGLLLTVIAHLNNHIGQMSYLVQALGQTTGEPPSW